MVDTRGTSGRRRLLRAGACALVAAGVGVALGSMVPIERARAEGNRSDRCIGGAPDRRWNDEHLATVKCVTGSHFEVVQVGELATR